MDRRTFLATLPAWPLVTPSTAATQPFRLALIGGAPEGEGYIAGIAIDLDSGWKTYWRVPGDAGIAPVFDFSKSENVATTQVLYPVPMRYMDQSGETIGFARRVVFPLRIKPNDPSVPARIDLHLFLGVCKDVCIPVDGRLTLDLAFQSPDPEEHRDVSDWLARVPVATTIVTHAEIGDAGLRLQLLETVDDIFVESANGAYFRSPRFSADGLEATLPVDGFDNPSQMKGQTLTLTLRRGEGGFEQTVTAD